MELTINQLEQIKMHFRLSPRQAETAKILMSGKVTTKEIAKELKVSPGAARQFIYNIHTKMRTESKGQLIVMLFDYILDNDIH